MQHFTVERAGKFKQAGDAVITDVSNGSDIITMVSIQVSVAGLETVAGLIDRVGNSFSPYVAAGMYVYMYIQGGPIT